MPERQTMPREAVADFMMARINGTTEPNPDRFGYMDRDRAAATIDLFKAAYSNPMTEDDLHSDEMKKAVTVATGLTYYDLRAPALNLFPTVTPLRNAIPRMQRLHPGDAAKWKAVTSTIGSGFAYMGWVPEGQRTASMSYQTINKSLPYMTIGEEDSLTEEARFAAEGFEDEDALVQLRLLLKVFVKEEAGILGGDNSLQLGVPGTPTVAGSGTGSTLPTNTYSVGVVALTQEGFLNSSVASGVQQAITITGNDSKTFSLNGGSSNKSVTATVATTAGQNLTATVPVVRGAVAYAWYAGTVGAETLQAITTINSVSFSTTLSTSNQSLSSITSDCSTNGIAFDGLLTTTFITANNAYVFWEPTGTPGTGTTLSASGAGGVNEIDTLLLNLWNNSRVSVTVIYVNAQELKNITLRVLTGQSAPLLRYNVQADQAGQVEYKLTAAGVVSFYFNPFTPDGGVKIPVKVHPNLAPGTILAWAEVLPPWYVSNATPEVAVVQTRQDYYAEIWPKTSRSQYYGIYSQEVLAVYAPFAAGIISNIANG